MGQAKVYFFRFLIIIGITLIIFSCQRNPELNINETITCDLEQISDDGMFFISSSHPGKFFAGTEKLTHEVSRSGNNAVLVKKGQIFGLRYDLKNVNSDEYYVMKVWRKGPNNLGTLAISDNHDKIFYTSTDIPDTIAADGWERLSISFYIPPNFRNVGLKIYVWNKSEENVYFDDISIGRLSSERYPKYKNISELKLFVDTLNTIKLHNKRKQAFDLGILETHDDDWVDGIVFHDEQMYRADLRLKGDWLDHLLGSKWSFRIKLKKGQTWEGMRTFSIQNPGSRDFLNEWVLHKFCHKEDILAPRYGFLPVIFNNKSLGIYAFEEHFEKYLIEFNSRREGPIIKVNENAHWANVQLKRKSDNKCWLPVIHAAEILPFKVKRTTNDKALFRQYLIAQELYYQYKYAIKPGSEIFDLDKLGRYMAMLDLFRTYHGLTWHNQRFYYNPVLSKLEPITFDNFSERGPVQYVSKAIVGNNYITINEANDANILLGNIFRDTAFTNVYIKYLEIYSDEEFIKKVLSELSEEISFYDSLIKIEYHDYQYDADYLLENARKIKEELPEFRERVAESHKLPAIRYSNEKPAYDQTDENGISTHFVKAYTESRSDTNSFIKVENYFTKDILILGTAKSTKGIRNYFLPGKDVLAISGRDYGIAMFESDTLAEYLYYLVKGDMTTYMVPIFPWRKPGNESPLQKMMANYADNYMNYFKEGPGRQLILHEGLYEISEPLIIPRGHKVIINEGVQINIVNSAPFISYSAVSINGTADKPVIIKSSDGTANGFTVLQAPERSLVEYTIFDRLNTLDKDGWTLTGAVTFYESDVDFYNTSFQNNLCEDGLNIIRSDFVIDQCEIVNTFSDALDVDFGTGTISNTEFKYLNNDGIDVSGSDIKIFHCIISQSNDKGISGGENSIIQIENTTVEGSEIGIASKDFSRVNALNCTIEDCRYGLVVFWKKPEFGAASIEASDLILNNVATTYLIEEGSKCIVDGIEIRADKKNVYDMFYN